MTSSASILADHRRAVSMENALAAGLPPPLIACNDRIVWLSDNGPEFGRVKWLGLLPDEDKDWVAGVDFDNPVGSGTGCYIDQQLFEAPEWHASFVPVMGLMRASDFDESLREVSSTAGNIDSTVNSPWSTSDEPPAEAAAPSREQHLIEFSCPICYQRIRNIVFMCGHSACKNCAQVLETCHICRKVITQRINLY